MIDAREVLKSLKLPAPDEVEVRRLGAEIVAAVKKDGYDGRPFNINIPVGEDEEQHVRSYRIACALQRRFQANLWIVHLETTQDAFGRPEVHSLWFAIDPVATRVESVAKTVAPVETKFSLRGLHEELSSMFGGGAVAAQPLPSKPVLSVLLGTYNRLPLLKTAIQSVRQAVGAMPYEIVVVDGGSVDGSRAWLAAQLDVLLVAERRLDGAVRAFNQAFSLCRGEFVCNANDDIAFEGNALAEGVKYLREHQDVGQVAFALRGEGEEYVVNEVYPGHVYANHGIVRKSIADQIARITNGMWATVYHTYAADCEFSAWVSRLGHKVVGLPHLRVLDSRPDDGLREKNRERYGADTKRMYARWPAAAFKPDGPEPRVTQAELDRYRAMRFGATVKVPFAEPKASDALDTFVDLVGFPEPGEERRLRKVAPLLRALDPVDGKFPARAVKMGAECVLHVHINGEKAVDQQEGLVRALRDLGSGGYEMVRWTDFEHEERQKKILEAATRLRPSLIFMQLQTPGAVDLETVRKLREIVPEAVIVTWNGDIAECNSMWEMDWQVPFGRLVDLTLHSSFTHVRALRAAGVSNACYLQIGVDHEQYKPPYTVGNVEMYDVPDSILSEKMGYQCFESKVRQFDFDVVFLGSKYGSGDAFSSTYNWKNGAPAHDAALRDEVVEKMRAAFGERFGLFGSGWGEGSKVVPVTKSHEVYWKSKIGLSISLDNALEMYTSDRLFRILGCGALLLVKRFPGMATLGLIHGTNCLVFDTAEEAVESASWILGYKVGEHEMSEVKRVKIAEAGARLALEHAWSIRMRELQPYLDVVRSARR